MCPVIFEQIVRYSEIMDYLFGLTAKLFREIGVP